MINFDFIRQVGIAKWAWRTFVRQFSKLVLSIDNSIALPTGLTMRLPKSNKFSSEVFVTGGNVDWGSERVFFDNLDRDGVVLDIGAHVGYYSLYVLPAVAAIHAFEPDPRVQGFLRDNLAPYPNAYFHRLAVGKCLGRTQFALGPSPETSRLLRERDQPVDLNRPAGICEVDVTTVDHFVENERLSVTGIRIDVEGVDLDVIEGAVRTLQTQAPLVLAETSAEARLFELIAPLHYRVYAFVRRAGRRRVIFAEIRGAISGTLYAHYKMLFLVPPRLHQTFSALALNGDSIGRFSHRGN